MNVTKLLCQLMEKQTMPSAILLEGHAKSVDEQLREVFSHWFCQTHENCGICEWCQLYAHENLPDFHLVSPHQAGHAIKIEQIRDLHDICRQTPQILDFQVVWIQHADTMNEFAANALLKVLEEPIKNFFFLLSAENAKFLPLTIRSRCWILPVGDDQEVLTESQTQLIAQKDKLLELFYGFVQHQVDLAMMIKSFEAYPIDDVLWLLQLLVADIIQGMQLGLDESSEQQFAASIAVPVSYWWRLWDALIDARKKIRLQTSLQSNILLSRMLLILHGSAYE